MLGLGLLTFTNTHPIFSSIPIPIPIPKQPTTSFPSIKILSLSSNPRGFKASSFSEDKEELSEEEDEDMKKKKKKGPGLNLRWSELVLNPDPDNVVAVGLTGVLAWASVQILWQLFVISFAILIAAVKYSFIAALLIFILITLL